ncbi:MAG TPA: polysaccharide deacetylase family protein [Microlunatus sp.]|nr:polysaccharide deacetylase family protein [Microlunatus sp.]
MIIRRAVLTLVLILFASLTIGVIVGLDTSARSAIVDQLIGSPSAVPTPAEESISSPPKKAATPRPRATVATPTTAPSPTAKPTPKVTATAKPPVTAKSTATAKPRMPAKPKPTPSKPRPTPGKPTSTSGSKPTVPAKKSSGAKYLKGPLKKGPGGTVYLTFDDGPSPYTSSILSILDRTGSTATFFHLGVNEAGFPHADAAIRAQGSKVANHSYDHPDLTTRTAAQLKRQITHGPKAKCFRPPYGAADAAVRKAIAKAGLREVLWSVDTLDWTKPGVTTLAKTGRLKSIGNGTIVLMHDGGGDRTQTVVALPRVIADLHARGYQVRALPYC